MAQQITVLSPIPPRTIVLWDSKYRREGGSYPSLSDEKIARWKPEIALALTTSIAVETGRISGPFLSHVNATIAEHNAYQVLLENGHYGIKPPGRPTAPGADFITYFHGSALPMDVRAAVNDALSLDSIVGRIFRWPACIVTA